MHAFVYAMCTCVYRVGALFQVLKAVSVYTINYLSGHVWEFTLVNNNIIYSVPMLIDA